MELSLVFQETSALNKVDMKQLKKNVKRIAHSAICRLGKVSSVVTQGESREFWPVASPAATLCPCPQSLYVLWEEYTRGVGGRKPAKLSRSFERGWVKFKYCRRLIVWSYISRLVCCGFTSNVAMDQIYKVYGREKTVTQIINLFLRDRQDRVVHTILEE